MERQNVCRCLREYEERSNSLIVPLRYPTNSQSPSQCRALDVSQRVARSGGKVGEGSVKNRKLQMLKREGERQVRYVKCW
jgi:hypothetical protein